MMVIPHVHSRPTALRISPVANQSGPVADALSKTALGPDGQPLAIFGVLANHLGVLRKFNSFGALLRHSEITELSDRELLVLRVAARTDCTFEFDQHAEIARNAGLSEPAIAAARGGTQEIDPRQLLLLQIADEIIDDDAVADATWHAAAGRWSEEQLIELVATVAFFRMAAVLLNTLGVRPRDTWT
jgi:4-carboxymuconolactone decarboxylase